MLQHVTRSQTKKTVSSVVCFFAPFFLSMHKQNYYASVRAPTHDTTPPRKNVSSVVCFFAPLLFAALACFPCCALPSAPSVAALSCLASRRRLRRRPSPLPSLRPFLPLPPASRFLSRLPACLPPRSPTNVGCAVEPVPSACCLSVLLLVDRSDSSPDLRAAPCAVPGGQPPSFEGCCWGARIPSPRPGRLCSTIAIPPPCLAATVNLPPLATPLRNLLFKCWRYLGLSWTYLGPMLPPRSPMLPVCWPMSTLCCRALALSCPYVGLMVAYVAAMLASL